MKEVSVYRYSHNYLSGKDISDRVQITRIVELLNHFKYIKKEEPLPMAGCGTTYSLCMKGGFREIWIDFDSSRIFVEKRNKSGTEIFHGPPDYFQPLVDLVDSAAERD